MRSIPEHGLACRMGRRGLWDLRRKAEAGLGSGSLPLQTLSHKVDPFIGAERRR